MINSKDWMRVFGFGIVGAVTMVIVALLQEGVVGGLSQRIWNTCMYLYFLLQAPACKCFSLVRFCPYLREAGLVVKDTEDALGPGGDQLKTGVKVLDWHGVPLYLFCCVLLLQCTQSIPT